MNHRSRKDRDRAKLAKAVWGTLLGFLLAALWVFAALSGAERTPGIASLTSVPEVLMPVWLNVLTLIALTVLGAAAVASETAVELLRPHHVKLAKDRATREGEQIEFLLERQATFAASLALASQLIRLGMVMLVLLLAPAMLAWGHTQFGWSVGYGQLVLTTLALMIPIGSLHVVFGELIPRSYAALHPVRVATLSYSFIRAVGALLSPGASAVTWLAELLTKRFGGRASLSAPNAAEEEILTLVESAEETGEIEQGERELLRSVFDFTDTVVREVMTPRVDMDALPVRSDPMEVVRLIQESGHSRIPLYEETDDQIVGVIHAKDLLLAMLNGKAPNLRSLMRPALFVPENKNLYELITEMRQHRTQMAVVQDEFGGTAGIATIEDIVEELVGEIVDEYDVEEPDVVPSGNGWLIRGKAHLDDVNEAIQSNFQSEEFDTLGGYVFGKFGRQPRVDETIEIDGFRFRVMRTDGRRIVQLYAERIADQAELEAVESD